MTSNPSAKILIIDDETNLLRSIAAYLEDSNFVVFTAENGKEGLQLYNDNKPDLVLTDLHMPLVGGLEVLRTITRSIQANQENETPVIVISGAGELNDAIEALRLGAWDYITKPIADLQVLEHAVNKALERKNLIAQNKIYAQKIEHNLKVLTEDQAAGRRVQMSLLPAQQLKLANYSFDYRIIPSLELSGDFVEYFAINESTYVTYLADVSGHGVSSAFITVLLKSLIMRFQEYYKSNQDDRILRPEKIMPIISNEIYSIKLSKYLTLIYGVLDIEKNTFTYGIGGHYPSPILLAADGSAKFLDGSGFPVGVISPVSYDIHTINLQAGDRLFMFSDGIMEILLPGQSLEVKEAALLEQVKKYHNDINVLLKDCGLPSEETNPLPDDLTILVIGH